MQADSTWQLLLPRHIHLFLSLQGEYNFLKEENVKQTDNNKKNPNSRSGSAFQQHT